MRRFTDDDSNAMFNNWASDPDVTKYLMWPFHKTIETSHSILSDWTSQYVKDDFYQWAIIMKDTSDEPIGSIGVVRVAEVIFATIWSEPEEMKLVKSIPLESFCIEDLVYLNFTR